MSIPASIRYSGLVRVALRRLAAESGLGEDQAAVEKLERHMIEHRLIPSPDLLCAIYESAALTMENVPRREREGAEREARRILGLIGDSVFPKGDAPA